ncbi:MAG: hypothetical protein CVU90_12125 [Firmicutes bacterium HGW-Firmicutes-15]|nr:MAG: hypothetical protein CVU90_12125 [Firmicutes bacterium HGW-Firmicutes-15]
MKRKYLALTLILALIITVFPSAAFALPEGVPSTLPSPSIGSLQLLKNESGVPYFRMEVTVPSSVLTLDQERPANGWVDLETSGKVENEEWGSSGGGGGYLDIVTEDPVPGKSGVYYVSFNLEDEGGLSETIIKSKKYTFRVRFTYRYDTEDSFDFIYSPWSNELSSQSGSYYQGASSWAVTELNKAQQYGFITDRIKGNMSGKITREEFAEIAVKLYEKYTGTKGTAGNASFIDTTNPEILKAANLGLVSGVGNNKYAPNELVTREQMATILLSALKVINPTADFSIVGVSKFADDDKVEAWAQNGVYYCSKAKIVSGVGNNLFDPDGNATREAAVIVCSKGYEYYKK